jgi:DNA processing protein
VRLSDEQRIDWLRLIRSEGIGPRTFRTLVNRFGGARGALDALPDIARRSGRAVKVASRTEAERELSAAARLGARFIASGEPEYPRTLQAIDTAPPLVAVLGEVGVLARPMVAVVGSRNASASGLAFTDRLSRGLGGEGHVIVSGLARGIDARAHKAALGTGTIAVLAGGLDRLYPAEHAGLAKSIVDQGGAIVSEMPFGWEPRARDFPRRNRIVSGIAYGVVVVEAARRSGSLITARFALEQGREVFAVPGSPLDPRAEGTNDLIRQGANLCAAVEHVVSVLAPLIERGTVPERQLPLRAKDFEEEDGFWDEWGLEEAGFPAAASQDDPQAETDQPGERARLVALLSPAPVAVDELARQSGLPIRTVQTIVFELELAGRLERHGANAVSLIGG